VNGTAFAPLATETASFGSVGGNDFVTFALDTPVALDPSTTYGFDIGLQNPSPNSFSTVGWQLLNNTGEFADGRRYSSGSGGTGAATVGFQNPVDSDRIFHVNLEAAAAPSGPQLIADIACWNAWSASMSVFDRNPHDLKPDDGISVSQGSDGGLIDGWRLTRRSDGASFTGLLRNDGGANNAGATSPDFPARLEGNTTGSWSIFIPEDVTLNLDRIEFDVRGATGGDGRQGAFTTSLEGLNLLWEDLNLPGRNAPGGGWMRVTVDLSSELYQGLTDQELAFIWLTNPGPGTGAIDLDTIQLFGSLGGAGIPEPATATLALLGIGGLMMRRRRADA